uniref:Putative zinc-or iron-chelating protein n=1 Tax=viral metagenome TaxID=1070528 RepID=A0A6M3LY97_9ZZZZ
MVFECLKNCGKCCRGVSVSQEFFEKHHPEVPYRIDKRGNYVHANADVCVWLGKDKKCTIYKDRPPACKEFGSGILANEHLGYKCAFKTPDGKARDEEGKHNILNLNMPSVGKKRFITDKEMQEVFPDE